MNEAEMERTLKKVIVTFGDRKHSGFCLKCGTDILEPYNDYQCCVKCTRDIELAKVEQARKSKHYHGMGKITPPNDGKICIQSQDILRQAMPIGVPVK